jgi:hypothetical protein
LQSWLSAAFVSCRPLGAASMGASAQRLSSPGEQLSTSELDGASLRGMTFWLLTALATSRTKN